MPLSVPNLAAHTAAPLKPVKTSNVENPRLGAAPELGEDLGQCDGAPDSSASLTRHEPVEQCDRWRNKFDVGLFTIHPGPETVTSVGRSSDFG